MDDIIYNTDRENNKAKSLGHHRSGKEKQVFIISNINKETKPAAFVHTELLHPTLDKQF